MLFRVESIFKNPGGTRRIAEITMIIAVASVLRIDLFTAFTEGFGIACDVVLMGLFIYLFREFKALQIIRLSAIASTLFRTLTMYTIDHGLGYVLLQASADFAFFIVYGIVYEFLSRRFDDENIADFMMIILTCDFCGNMGDLLVRTLVIKHTMYSIDLIGLSGFAAFIRTLLVASILISIEAYQQRQRDEEHLRQYTVLVNKATIILDEIQMMKKNMADVEGVMKRGYDLYQELDQGDYPKEVAEKALEVAKLIHEIKGDYRNVVSVLYNLYDEDVLNRSLGLEEILRLEKADVDALIEQKHYPVQVIVDCEDDCEVDACYQLMSVIRNLLTNAVESVSEYIKDGENGWVHLTAHLEEERLPLTTDDREGGDATDDMKMRRQTFCQIDVTDNGRGIRPGREDVVFQEGYSTKFDHRTGYIQRGLGLSVVKDYVEEDLHGTIEVLQDLTRGAHFRVRFPVAEEAEAETSNL